MAGYERKLDELFATYRDSLPDREPSVNFTAELWRRIDERRQVRFSFTRFARVFVTASVALCFGMTAITWSGSGSSVVTATYVDVLNEEPHEVEAQGETL